MRSRTALHLPAWWHRSLAWALLLLAGLVWHASAPAQSLESVLRPGDLIEGHARWEDECSACHVRFQRDAQDGLCQDCHKDVGRDMRERRGYHGRLPAQACRSCHTDHKGRRAVIVQLDPQRFDHTQTDYALHGKHRAVECQACHTAGRKYRDAPTACQACHRADDVHKGSLGAQCADCHVDTGWKDTRFDHAKTRFPLTGRHADAGCTDCHRSAVYGDAPTTCIGCHRSDDQGPKGHQGRFGERCDSCHGTAAWKPSRFDHNRDTHFPLAGAHLGTACTSCHTGQLYRDKLGSACIDCHRDDDAHKGSLGNNCQSCHTVQRWKDTPRFDHDRTQFKLEGKHGQVACADCHRDAAQGRYQVSDTRCVACHRDDDPHELKLGERCDACHVAADWKRTGRFDHAASRFPLRGAHADVACASCHKTPAYRGTPLDCVSCHRADDKHEGQLGERCESCHGEARWDDTRFDHARARFALVGRHVAVACKDCHSTPRYRDAPETCVACHREDDRHRGGLGEDCASCHNARDWRLGRFDHGRTAFALDGAHQPLRCEACHRAPAPAGQAIAPLGAGCVACHRADDRHEGAFGPRCDQCHVSTHWKQLRRRPGQTSMTAPPASPPSPTTTGARPPAQVRS